MPLPSIIREYRSAYSGLTRDSWALAMVMLINRSGAMVLPFMSLYVTHELKFSLTEAGILVSLFGAGSIAGAWFGGMLVDRFGAFRIQVISLTLAGFAYFCLIPLSDLVSLGTGLFLVTFFADMFRPANSASVAGYSSPESVARSFSLNRMAANLGFAIGPALGGLLTTIDFRLIFVANGVGSLTAALVFFRMFHHRPEPIRARSASWFGAAYSDRGYLAFLLLVALYAMAFFQLFSTMPVFFRTSYQLSEPVIGLLLALNGFLVFLVEMVLVNRLESRVEVNRIIPLGVLLLAAAFLLLGIGHAGWILVVCIVLLSFSEMLAMPFMATWVTTRSGGRDLGSYMALYAIAYGVSLIGAPVIGTRMADGFGFSTLWFSCTIGLLVLAVLFSKLPKKENPV